MRTSYKRTNAKTCRTERCSRFVSNGTLRVVETLSAQSRIAFHIDARHQSHTGHHYQRCVVASPYLHSTVSSLYSSQSARPSCDPTWLLSVFPNAPSLHTAQFLFVLQEFLLELDQYHTRFPHKIFMHVSHEFINPSLRIWYINRQHRVSSVWVRE